MNGSSSDGASGYTQPAIEGTGMRQDAKYKSAALKAVHQSASALLRAGAIHEATMRRFDASCLVLRTTPAQGLDQALRSSRLAE